MITWLISMLMKLGLYISILLFTYSFGQDRWVQEYDKNGIKIYTRTVEGTKTKEYKGVVEVKATVHECLNLIRDLDKSSSYMYKVEESEMIKVVSDSEWITYQVISFPWPYSNKDLVLKFKVYHLGKGVYTAKFFSVSGVVPPKGYDRMQNIEGSWLFEPITEHTTRVTNKSKAYTKGFPVWLVNLFFLNAPKHIMPAFREEVE